MRFLRLLSVSLITLSTWTTAHAAPPALFGAEWELCGEPDAAHAPRAQVGDPSDQTTYLDADQSETTRGELFNFSGNVVVRRANQRIEADSALYDKSKDTVDAQGNVRYDQDGLRLEGDSAHVKLGPRQGHMDNARFSIAEKHGRGDAARILMEGPNQNRLKRAKYTTCNPGNDDWYIHSNDVKLDREKGVGTARHVWLEFKGVPFLYTPYMSFPLDNRRKSGFLTPSFGNSDQVGTELLTPYYWNIAPQRDATITPRFTSKRGLHLLGEYRYLYPAGAGQIDVGYVPQDRLRGDESREFLSLRHSGSFAPRWSTNVYYNYVSDKDYFKDLGTTLSVTSITHLERRGEVAYSGDYWQAIGRLHGYQTIDPTLPGSSRPYQRLPQLLLNANLPQQAYGANYLFNGEYVHFDRFDSLTADRIDVQPGVSLPLTTSYGYLTPSLALRHTQYGLASKTPGVIYDTSRTLPTLSVDSGVVFERDASWGARNFLHTLEPRLFYLYVPYEDQSNIPVFDTGLLGLNFDQLFQTNRFSGTDRVGDANQFTAALTSRLLDSESGAELLNGRVGQIFYLRDREVTLPGGAPETFKQSDIFAEAGSAQLINHWSANATLQWNPRASRSERLTVGASYEPTAYQRLDLNYRFLNDQIDQTEVAAVWPLARNQNRHWNAVARWNYSLRDDRTFETLAGVEYDTCCWAVRVAGRQFITDVSGATNNAVFIQFELKGLTSFGSKGVTGLKSLLDPNVLNRGYQFNR